MNPFNELKNVKTLLVDDDEFIRNSLELAFKTKGCSLQVAESAEQGLKAIQQQQYDIIISDLRLPGINGLEFLKLSSVTQPQAIRFLITAYRDDHIFSEAVRLGINEFIEKPFAVKVLINLLALALKRQTHRKGSREYKPGSDKAGKLESSEVGPALASRSLCGASVPAIKRQPRKAALLQDKS